MLIRNLRIQYEQKKAIRMLHEALQDLLDEQNGAPLIRREAQWNEAMKKASKALDFANKLKDNGHLD